MAAPPGKVLPFKNARPPQSIRPTRPTISASHKPPVGVQDDDMEEYPSTYGGVSEHLEDDLG